MNIFNGECNGQKIESINSINMTKQFNDIVVCARRGGKSFIDSIRIDPRKEKCPEELLPCIQDSFATQTTCV